MEDELDPNVLRKTQLSLGKHVKRPPLSDKLLKKPPFRFLHDIVTAVLKNKGFFKGLFDESELISENVKDRESKISFLNKVISVISLATGKSLSVKPSKIVAGQEPEKTNELLQCLAHALDNNLSSDEAVKQFKLGVQISSSDEKKSKDSLQTLKKNTETKKLTSRSSENIGATEKISQAVNRSKNKEPKAHKKVSPPKKTSTKQDNKKPIEKSIEVKKRDKVDEKSISDKITDNLPNHMEQNSIYHNVGKELMSNGEISQPDLQPDLPDISSRSQEEKPVFKTDDNILNPTQTNNTITLENQPNQLEASKDANLGDNHFQITNKDKDNNDNEETEKQSTSNLHNTNTNGGSEDTQKEREKSSKWLPKHFDKNEYSNVMRPASVRPSSSRPGAPRIKDKSDYVINDAENIIVGKVNIISEHTLHEEEENTNIIIEDKPEEFYETLKNQDSNDNAVNSQNSHLVQQILDSQREYSQMSGKTEIEWQFGTQKAPNIFIQEMEQLKFNVQALSRVANPLGKLLDHIQEDVEVMRQELQQWTKVYDETSKDLLKQKTANDDALQPFNTKLIQLTKDIEEKHEKITDLKISIYKNNLRIEKLLANTNVQ